MDNDFAQLNNRLIYISTDHGPVIMLYPPNIMSICWVIMCLKIAVTAESSSRGFFDYLLYVICVLFFFHSFLGKRRADLARNIIALQYILLLGISVLGLMNNYTSISLTSILGVFCVMSLVISCGFSADVIQPVYIMPSYCMVLVKLFIQAIKGERFGNTTPGVLIFLTFGFIICVLYSRNDSCFEYKLGRFVDLIVMCCAIVLSMYISLKSNARTAVFTEIGILVCFFIFRKINISRHQLIGLFWVICVLAILLNYIYINIHSFGWYEVLNQYSRALFGKNIDSSRPALWLYSLKTLSGQEILIGKGTGVLPEFRDYSSFHSSFIQLIMQNGIIGLLPVIIVFRVLWGRIVNHSNDVVCRLSIACFIGIIVYNLFECTLFQNKVFLGMCEWIIICMGVVRSNELSIRDIQ